MSAEVAMSQDPSVQTLNAVLEALSQGREVAATDVLIEHLDALFLAGAVEKVRRLLPQLDPQRLPPKVLSGVLMVTEAAKEALGEERIANVEVGCFRACNVTLDGAAAGGGIPAFIKEGDFRNGFLKPYFPKESMPAVKALCSDLTIAETEEGCSVSAHDGDDWLAPLVVIDVKDVGTVVTFCFSSSGWTWITAEP